MICKNCKNKISDFSAFCPHCGMLFVVPTLNEEQEMQHKKEQLPIYNADMYRKMIDDEASLSKRDNAKSVKTQSTTDDSDDDIQLDKLYTKALQLERAEKIAKMKQAAEERAREADEIARKKAEEELKQRMAESERHNREVAEELVKERVISKEELEKVKSEDLIQETESVVDKTDESEDIVLDDAVIKDADNINETIKSEGDTSDYIDDSDDYVFGDEDEPGLDESEVDEESITEDSIKAADENTADDEAHSDESETEEKSELEAVEQPEASDGETEDIEVLAHESAEEEQPEESTEITEESADVEAEVNDAEENKGSSETEAEEADTTDDTETLENDQQIEIAEDVSEIAVLEAEPGIDESEVDEESITEDSIKAADENTADDEAHSDESETEEKSGLEAVEQPEASDGETEDIEASGDERVEEEQPEESTEITEESADVEAEVNDAEENKGSSETEAEEVDISYVTEALENDKEVEITENAGEIPVLEIAESEVNEESITKYSKKAADDTKVKEAEPENKIIDIVKERDVINDNSTGHKDKKIGKKVLIPVASVILAALVGIGYYAWTQQPEQQYIRISKSAEQAYVSGDFASAEKCYTQLAEYGDLNDTMYMNLADSYVGMDKHEDAVATLQKAISKYPDNAALTSELNDINPSVKISQPDGTYSEPLTIELSASSNCDIFYSLHEDDKPADDVKYDQQIVLDANGTYTLDAYGKTADGYSGPVSSAKYVIDIEPETEPETEAVEETHSGEFDVAAEYAQYPDTLIEIQTGDRKDMGEYSVFEAQVYHSHTSDKPEGDAKTETVKVSNKAWLHYLDYNLGEIPVRDAYVFLPYIGMLNATTDENGIITKFDFILGSQK